MASCVLMVWARPAAAQAPEFVYRAAGVDGAHFAESVQSDVVTASGSAQVHRTIARTAVYSFRGVGGDTLLVTIDTMTLRETDDGIAHDVDVDAVIGARWKIVVAGSGDVTVIERPFVPDPIAEVSDVGKAMDDFFPATDRGAWHREGGSHGVERWQWDEKRRMDSTGVPIDSATQDVHGSVHDHGEVQWQRNGGVGDWSREVDMDFDSRVAGRAVRGAVKQRIHVVRVQ